MENQKNLKIDLSSKMVEKAIDIAKDFLDKLIMPTIEEAGLLLKDQVTYIKFKNQVKILNKAHVYCEKHKISTKTISLKLLCPLLENAALEEDDYLQDKWAMLLGNLVDSEQNIENHVFPYLLSQISINEFKVIESLYSTKAARVSKSEKELREYYFNRENQEEVLQKKIDALSNEIESKGGIQSIMQSFSKGSTSDYQLSVQKTDLKLQLDNLRYKEKIIINEIKRPAIMSKDALREFELANLTRLGIIKEIHETFANTQTLEIPSDSYEDYVNVDFDADVYIVNEIIVTELGELFMKACNEKS